MRALAIVASLVTSALAVPGGEARADEAELPAPPVVLTVAPGSGGGPWTVRVDNAGEAPFRLAADPRLLVLEITRTQGSATAAAAPDGRRAKASASGGVITCSLPEDARPSTDEGQELVVPGKHSWSAKIDPLYYCFDARARAALAPGAVVRARLGWPARAPSGGRIAAKAKPLTAPFVLTPVGAAVGKFPPAKVIEGTPVTLAEDQRVEASPSPPAPTAKGLTLSSSATLDAAKGAELPVTVTLVNEGDRAATVLFRPDTVRFRVAGAAGSVSCGPPVEMASPIRELFTTLPPGGRAQLTVLLATKCPPDTFDAPGLYRATAILDTSLVSGRSIGLRSFNGVVTATAPTLVRVRQPRRPVEAKRPVLD